MSVKNSHQEVPRPKNRVPILGDALHIDADHPTRSLMELADERQDLQVEARCWCGERATHNARLVDGVFTLEGELHMVGDTGDPEDHQERFALETPRVTYELLCRRHWLAGEPTSPPA